MNPFSINCPNNRAVLDARDKPYFVRVTDTVHLGYKKGKSVCRWIIRWRVANTYISRTFRSVIPDDTVPANGTSILSYEQALLKATYMNIETINQSKTRHCSFCNKPQTDAKLLIAGPNSYICGECVEICNSIIANRGHFEEVPDNNNA